MLTSDLIFSLTVSAKLFDSASNSYSMSSLLAPANFSARIVSAMSLALVRESFCSGSNLYVGSRVVVIVIEAMDREQVGREPFWMSFEWVKRTP